MDAYYDTIKTVLPEFSGITKVLLGAVSKDGTVVAEQLESQLTQLIKKSTGKP